MEQITMKTSHTDSGFCCTCDELPGWTVSGSKDFAKFNDFVKESLDFYIECARNNNEAYPPVLDREYEIKYQFDTCGLLNYYQSILSFAGLQNLTGINQKQLAHYAAGRSKPRAEQVKKIEDGLHKLAKDLNSVSVLF